MIITKQDLFVEAMLDSMRNKHVASVEKIYNLLVLHNSRTRYIDSFKLKNYKAYD